MEEIKFNYPIFENIFNDTDNRISKSEALNKLIDTLNNELNIDKDTIFSIIKAGYTCALIDTDAILYYATNTEQNNK